MSSVGKLQFRPRARIIRTIGDQLISGSEAAIIELVKNSYDADASRVDIAFFPPFGVGSGRISVSDNGHGMSVDDIRLKWMEPATSSKVANRKSKKLNRAMMGSKGIGRFAAAKLGRIMSLTSTVQAGNGHIAMLIPELDWSIFNEDAYLADIEIDFLQQPSDGPTGTTIEILGVNENWTKAKFERLYSELRRLLSPFVHEEDAAAFSIYLDLSRCTTQSSGFDGEDVFGDLNVKDSVEPASSEIWRVHPFPVLSASDYELKGSFDESGQFDGTFQVRRAGRSAISVQIQVPLGDEEASPGAFEVQLSVFDREDVALRSNMASAGMGDLTASQARKLLDNVCGVAIYRDGFRVRPYGDPQNDWLTLDSRRVQDPSMKIGHNQVAGYITIGPQEASGLVEKSSREGFEENAAFRRLTRLVTTLLARVVEPGRYDFRKDAGIARSRSTTFDEVRKLSELKRVRGLLDLLAPSDRAEAEKVIDLEAKQLHDRIDQLQDRQRVLEAQSSLGAIIGEVLHEGGPKAGFIARTTKHMVALLGDLSGGKGNRFDDALNYYKERLHQVRSSGDNLVELFTRLRPLAGGKRGAPKFFYPGHTISDVIALFERHSIEISVSSTVKGLELLGYPDDLTTALVNLVNNAVYWLEESQTFDPNIKIVIGRQGDLGRILVADNGPGIRQEFVEHIFDVGFSLKENGTGLGLNIAREALARSGAKLLYHLESERGAVFEILFPARKEG